MLILVLLGPASTAAEARFEPAGAVQAGERLRARVMVENAGASSTRLELPTTPGVTWLDQRKTRQQEFSINGVASHTDVWTVFAELAARERWEIPPITIHLADGSTLRTATRTLEPTAVVDFLRGDFACAVSFDPPVIVPGQETELVYHLYLREPRGVELDEGLGVRLPDAATTRGESRVTGQQTVFDGMHDAWTRVELRWPLIVSQPGTYEVGGQQGFKRARVDRFGRQVGYRNAATVPIRPGTLEVTTLPTTGRPEDYTGLIGAVRIEAELERPTISLGEGTGYTVTVHGHQLELLDRLPLPAVEGLRARLVDDEAVDDTTHRYRFNLEPQRVGSYEIPAPDLSWFDPETRRYRRSTAPTRRLEVLPGRQRELDIAGTFDRAQGEQPAERRPDLPPPLRGAGMRRPAPHWGWILLAVGALAGLAMGLGQRAIGRLERGPDLDHRLSAAIDAGDLAAIDRLLHQALAIHGEDDTAAELRRVIDAVEHARFGGGALDPGLVERLRSVRERLG